MKSIALLVVCGLAAGAMAQPVTTGFADGAGVAPTGDILWQQLPNPDLSAFVDQQFPDFADFSTYLVSDVQVGDGGWNITSVTTWLTNLNGTWPGDHSGVLNIFKKTGALPVGADDPTTGMVVPVSIDGSGVMTASGLDIDLAPGDYWIGLTADINFGEFGQEFHQGSDNVFGDASAGRNPGGAFGLGADWFDAGVAFGGISGWEASIQIGGTVVPAPGAIALLGMGGLFCARRRR